MRAHYREAAREGDEDVLDGLDDAADPLDHPQVRAALIEAMDDLDGGE